VVNVVLILVQLVALANLSRALGYSILMTIAFLLLLFLPLIALIVLLVLIGKATRRLKEAGYRVGLFGAKETPPALDAPSDEHAFQDHFSDE
jgi:hypothetical protein